MNQHSNKEGAEELDDDSDDEDFKPDGEDSDNDTNLKLEKEENDLDDADNLVFSRKRRSGALDTASKKSKATHSEETETQNKNTNDDNAKSKVDDIWEQMKAESQTSVNSEVVPSSYQPTAKTITPSVPQQSTVAPKAKTVTQTYDFAGETVKVVKPVSAPVQSKGKPKTNLDDLLGSMKKKKISTMEKSQLDWQNFKSNQGLEDELKQATKGGGYLDKQAFLQRTEWRQFEKERDVRLASINKKPQ